MIEGICLGDIVTFVQKSKDPTVISDSLYEIDGPFIRFPSAGELFTVVAVNESGSRGFHLMSSAGEIVDAYPEKVYPAFCDVKNG